MKIKYILLILFIGCRTLPENVSEKEYNSVKDYVSIKLSGLNYHNLTERIINYRSASQSNSPVDRSVTQNDKNDAILEKYNQYMHEVNYNVKELLKAYKRTEMVEDFYNWAIKNYDDIIR